MFTPQTRLLLVISKNLLFPVFILVLTSAGCGARPTPGALTTSTAAFATMTIPSSLTPSPSETPLPPLPQPTAAPVTGTTSTQVNVRSGPSTVGNVLGILPASTTVEIVGKDPAGNWWQILYPQGADGRGWVTAQYITTADPSLIPVVGGQDPASGNLAVVQQQINVRSGPGTGFNSLGTLNPQDVVSLTGKDSNGTWLQIEFASGPEGKGWVNAGFVQAQGVENLPIVTEGGEVVGTGTPTGIPPTPTPTLVPAPVDNDSAENPIIRVTFAPTGAQTLIYNGDVSSPTGDKEDWIQFVPFSRQVRLEVSCLGSDIDIELLQNGSSLGQAACAGQAIIPVEPDRPVLLHVMSPSQGSLRYTSYNIKVITVP
jgi:uncharacterized protein YraI